jgi:hypothetical protein
MNPNELENLLGRMPLRKPPASLDRRVLSARPRRGHGLALAAAGVGLAAAAVLVVANALTPATVDPPAPGAMSPPETVVAAPPQAVEAAPAETPQPLRVEANWSTVSYEGMVVPDDRTPLMKFRRQRIEYVETLDEATGTRLQAAVPREEIILVKATVY